MGVDLLVGLPMATSGFDQVQAHRHVHHPSGKVRAVPARATGTAADAAAARIVREMARRSGGGIPDATACWWPVVGDRAPKLTSTPFKESTRRIRVGSSLPVGSAYNKNTSAWADSERVNGVLGYTLRAFANGRKDDWGV